MERNSSTRPPFDDADADVIFRSSDGVEFRLYKSAIAKASPVFRDMFTLPDGPVLTMEPQVVPLTEDADTLERLFRLCYPVERPRFASLEDVRLALEAAEKYMMEVAVAVLREASMEFLDAEPWRIYAIGYLWHDKQIARRAARQLLEHPQLFELDTMPSEFDRLPAAALYHVFQYRKQCVAAATAIVDDMTWMVYGSHGRGARHGKKNGIPDRSGTWCWLSCAERGANARLVTVGDRSRGYNWSSPSMPHRVYLQGWWDAWREQLIRELTLRPIGGLATMKCNLEPFLRRAGSCTHCAPQAYDDLTEYAQLQAERIDAAVAKVSIELPWNKPSAAINEDD